MSRYARKRDATHSPLVGELRAVGFSVLDLANLGGGVPDLLIGKAQRALLVEVKSPKRVRMHAGDGRSAAQRKWHDEWRGVPVIVAESLSDVLAAWSALQPETGARDAGRAPRPPETPREATQDRLRAAHPPYPVGH